MNSLLPQVPASELDNEDLGKRFNWTEDGVDYVGRLESVTHRFRQDGEDGTEVIAVFGNDDGTFSAPITFSPNGYLITVGY